MPDIKVFRLTCGKNSIAFETARRNTEQEGDLTFTYRGELHMEEDEVQMLLSIIAHGENELSWLTEVVMVTETK